MDTFQRLEHVVDAEDARIGHTFRLPRDSGPTKPHQVPLGSLEQHDFLDKRGGGRPFFRGDHKMLRPSVTPSVDSERTTDTSMRTTAPYLQAHYERTDFDELEEIASHGSREQSSTREQSSILGESPDDGVIRVARAAKKRVEAMARREAMLGNWRVRRRIDGNAERQILEHKSKRRDEYSIVVKMNLLCSLREIMNVLATDNSKDFHRSMIAFFGDQYVYGRNMRSIDMSAPRPPPRSSDVWSALLQRNSNDSMPRSRPTSRFSIESSNAKLSVNSARLHLRHTLTQQFDEVLFLDYLDEQIDIMALTRVVSLMLQRPSDAASALGVPEAIHMLAPDAIAGYVFREDPEEKFTRMFFYASAKMENGERVPRTTKRLLRGIANTTCNLERIVIRRRLGTLRSLQVHEEDYEPAERICRSCKTTFGLFQKVHRCACCQTPFCRQCLSTQDVEEEVGKVHSQRICKRCLGYARFPVLPNMVLLPATSTRSWAAPLRSTRGFNDFSDIPEQLSDDDSPHPPLLASMSFSSDRVSVMLAEEDEIDSFPRRSGMDETMMLTSQSSLLLSNQASFNTKRRHTHTMLSTDTNSSSTNTWPSNDSPKEAISILKPRSASTQHSPPLL
ncbi:hypothetical protein Poli38472_004803 [Pythium oligandrum]|uniref:FYVE-type domain-containing protein n=1 Tax=Pythium oligandrum TaxID=41045 RepID=A0A8K1CB01_PYTOL|nr:hypothetical protein Poli38472_004803 [Pythium oligandrum]|eukprot:TMW59734.1 hypothetical protein Poli38472_004803 [Pythium oligandrum]